MTSPSNEPFVVSLDVGSSSVRALLFDATGSQMEGYGAQLPCKIQTTPDGGAELHPDALADMVFDCLDEVHRQVHAAGMKIAAIAGCCWMHGIMGTDESFKATTPILHLFDTRANSYVASLRDASTRTGCPLNGSYWPAKLLWMAAERPNQFANTRHWMSFPEYFFAKLFGRPRASITLASASGLWNQRGNDWDSELIAATGIRYEQLASRLEMDMLERELLPKHREAWPAFARASWLPLIADGTAGHIGSGCPNARYFSLNIGTTGAVRVVTESVPARIEKGLWCYRADRSHFITGGALSNGGEVLAWMKRTLQLPKDIEARLDAAIPGTHGLGVLPFFAGERTPYWRGDLKAAITGLTFATEPFDILRAALEGVTLGFRQAFYLLQSSIGAPKDIIASGGALLRSPAWAQMLADALGHPVTASTAPEASARGAAMQALVQIGTVPSLTSIPTSMGATFTPRPEAQAAFDQLTEQRALLFHRLFDK